ncbi:MAG: hypothetical protein WCC37_00030 [Candidatus Sulfotelmatobacter sp.]
MVRTRWDFALAVFFAGAEVLVADFFEADFFCDFFFEATRLLASFFRTLFFAALAFFAAVVLGFGWFFRRFFLAAIIEEVYHFPEKPNRFTLSIKGRSPQ